MYDAIGLYSSPLGGMRLAASGGRLSGLWFEGQRYMPALPATVREVPVFAAARRWLDAYFEGRNPGVLPPLCLEGTPFRMGIWRLLLQIPYGETRTYKDLAEEWARRQGISRMSAQAVGNAVGHNPVAILVPCHRVVGSDGGLVGYAGGLERKRCLLALERAHLHEEPSRQEGKVVLQLFPEDF